MEYYFDTDDKLERKKYAEFLKSMLENCDKYRREDGDGAYVIAIDSPWGTGKTRFAKMMKNHLEGRDPILQEGKVDKKYISEPSDARKFNVIYYNSWETDYWGDALEPLIHNVLNSELFELIRADKDCDDVTNKLWSATKGVLKAVGLGFARNIIGDAAAEVIKGTIEELSKDDPDPLAAYSESIKMYNLFKDALTQTIKQTGRKLVIIVDELDRCRPTFAIQTLELAKHLFCVEGLIFVFALDVKQLSCSVKTVYGQEMDAAGYLCRFFDYIGRLPSPDHVAFIKMILSQYDFYKMNPSHFLDNNVEYIRILVGTFKLSLRDIVTILQSYGAMMECFLGNYDYYIKHHVYLFLLVLKYKDLDLYSRLFKVSSWLPNMKTGDSEKFNIKTNGEFNQYLTVLQSENPLRNSQFELKFDDSRDPKNARVIDVITQNMSRITVRFKVDPNGYLYEYDSSGDEKISWGNVLFKEDFYNWEKIKELTLSEYLYSQLEMFNFALPADEPTTKP